jgi:hypothetical protein
MGLLDSVGPLDCLTSDLVLRQWPFASAERSYARVSRSSAGQSSGYPCESGGPGPFRAAPYAWQSAASAQRIPQRPAPGGELDRPHLERRSRGSGSRELVRRELDPRDNPRIRKLAFIPRESPRKQMLCLLTDRASAATCPFGHYLTFLRTEASASCMGLLGSKGGAASLLPFEPHYDGRVRTRHEVRRISEGCPDLFASCGTRDPQRRP